MVAGARPVERLSAGPASSITPRSAAGSPNQIVSKTGLQCRWKPSQEFGVCSDKIWCVRASHNGARVGLEIRMLHAVATAFPRTSEADQEPM